MNNTAECSVKIGVRELGLEQKDRGKRARMSSRGSSAEPRVHGKAAEFPFSVPDDTIGSFSARRDTNQSCAEALQGWTGQEGILARDHMQTAAGVPEERWDLGPGGRW